MIFWLSAQNIVIHGIFTNKNIGSTHWMTASTSWNQGKCKQKIINRNTGYFLNSISFHRTSHSLIVFTLSVRGCLQFVINWVHFIYQRRQRKFLYKMRAVRFSVHLFIKLHLNLINVQNRITWMLWTATSASSSSLFDTIALVCNSVLTKCDLVWVLQTAVCTVVHHP